MATHPGHPAGQRGEENENDDSEDNHDDLFGAGPAEEVGAPHRFTAYCRIKTCMQ